MACRSWKIVSGCRIQGYWLMGRTKSRTLGLLFGTIILVAGAEQSANAQTMGSLAPRIADSGSAKEQWVTDSKTNCRALDPSFVEGDTATWQGMCTAGIANGTGTLVTFGHGKQIQSITGAFGGGILQTGHVTAIWADGSRYDGLQSHGLFDGNGVFSTAGGDRLEGEWKSGMLEGRARVLWANGDRYEGEWKNGKSDGQGTETWANGDRYTGQWRSGKAEGHGQQLWANGQTYDGVWRGDLPNGPGLLVRADGSRFQGLFVDGRPTASATAGIPPHNSALTEVPAAQPVLTPAVAKVEEPEATHQDGLPFPNLLGEKLGALDGSTIILDPNDGGFARRITAPNGSIQEVSLTFMNNRLGTVTSSAGAVGLFRAGNDSVEIDYTDGHVEILRAAATDGIALIVRSSEGKTSCAAWYPSDHVFSPEERQAAVQAYASRLGVASVVAKKKHSAPHNQTSNCADAMPTGTASVNAAAPDQSPHTPAATTATSGTHPPTANPRSQGSGSPQPVEVRVSPVHTIDAEFNQAPAPVRIEQAKFSFTQPTAMPPSAPISAALPASAPQTALANNPSQCLSVASNGEYWGFQNRCTRPLQFSYCEMGSLNPLISCSHSSVPGSVTANSFSPLVSDNSLKEQGTKHDFRWMACDGGAGEVVAHLDSVDPPVGRCDRLKSSE
jgi:hypothetical protein